MGWAVREEKIKIKRKRKRKEEDEGDISTKKLYVLYIKSKDGAGLTRFWFRCKQESSYHANAYQGGCQPLWATVARKEESNMEDVQRTGFDKCFKNDWKSCWRVWDWVHAEKATSSVRRPGRACAEKTLPLIVLLIGFTIEEKREKKAKRGKRGEQQVTLYMYSIFLPSSTHLLYSEIYTFNSSSTPREPNPATQ